MTRLRPALFAELFVAKSRKELALTSIPRLDFDENDSVSLTRHFHHGLLGVLLVFVSHSALAQTPEGSTVTISAVAIRATNEGRATPWYDPEVVKVKAALEGLDYDTFKLVKKINGTIPYRRKTEFQITTRYWLSLEALSKDSDGRIRMRVKIEMTPRPPETERKVILNTVIAMPRNAHQTVGGPPLDSGELIVVLRVAD